MIDSFLHLSEIWRDDRGADLVEYGLIAMIIALAGVVVFPSIGANSVTPSRLGQRRMRGVGTGGSGLTDGMEIRRSAGRGARRLCDRSPQPADSERVDVRRGHSRDLFHVFAPMGEGAGPTAVLGWLLGVAIFFVPFALGGLGGGDVKLLGALGAWLGPSGIFWAALYTGVAGGVMAIITALASGYFRKALSNVPAAGALAVAGIRALPQLTLDTSEGRSWHAIPIFAGTMVAIWLK